jgi:hypothetical protein
MKPSHRTFFQMKKGIYQILMGGFYTFLFADVFVLHLLFSVRGVGVRGPP